MKLSLLRVVRLSALCLVAATGLVACGGGDGKKPASSTNPGGPSANLPTGAAADTALRELLTAQGIRALRAPRAPDPRKVTLGQALFFDKELSGNRDVSCATCHHPSLGTSDQLSVSLGTGGTGLGPARTRGDGRRLIPRNSPELFTRGLREWTTLFWDGRVANGAVAGQFTTPAGAALPPGLDSVLAAQAMFPVTSVEEMRGDPGDVGVTGRPNELAAIPATEWAQIWNGIMQRLMAIEGYRKLFADAYPSLPQSQITYVHAANAIAAFEMARWTTLNSPWDRYVAGDNTALSDKAKQGGLLFFGRARCGECHSGPLLTDQQFHNIAVPQLGPGKGASVPMDDGRVLVTANPQDRFAFRTPALRNVDMTGPWMHNGAYVSLGDAVRHHLDPANALRAYDVTQLRPELQATVKNDAATVEAILATLDPKAQTPVDLSEVEIDQIMAFLGALTDPASMSLTGDIPLSVPSGLPIADLVGAP